MALAIDGFVDGANTTNTDTFTLNLTTTQSNDIIVLSMRRASDAILSVTGASIGSFTQLTTPGAPEDGPDVWVAFADDPLTSEVVTIVQTHNFQNIYDLFAVSGSNQTSLTGAFDAGGPIVQGGAPVDITTVNADTMVIGVFNTFIIGDPGPGPDYTAISSDTGLTTVYRVLSATSTETVGTGADFVCNGAIVFAIVQAAGGGGSTTTLTADVGSFTESGKASLFRISELTVKGTFTETGRAALFRVSELASKGTFTETGRNALFRISEVASKGTFTFTGKDVIFSVGARLTANVGTFTLSGKAALFRISELASKGTFTETGQAAFFKPSMLSSKATYSETGQSALFRINFVDSKGTFVLTGKDANLSTGAFVTGSTGTFTVSGKDALFRVSQLSNKGTFNLTGQTVRLTPGLVSGTGTFTESGKAALFKVVMPSNKGTFNFTGKDASLTSTLDTPVLSEIIIRRRRRFFR